MKTFKGMLRLVVGKKIASARTETDRMRFYRQFLRDVAQNASREMQDFLTNGKNVILGDVPEADHAAIGDNETEIATRIEEQKKTGFDDAQIARLETRFGQWAVVMRSRASRKAAKKRWAVDKPKKRRK